MHEYINKTFHAGAAFYWWPLPPSQINVFFKWFPNEFLNDLWPVILHLYQRKHFSREGKKKQKTEWIFGSFLPGLPGSKKKKKESVDDVPWVLKQPQVSGGRIWKICGICQHLTILSRQYISCLIEKCVLNCRCVPPFFWRTFFNLTLRENRRAAPETRRRCRTLPGSWSGMGPRGRGLQKHCPEDKHKHLRT